MPAPPSQAHIFVCTSDLPPQVAPSCGANGARKILDLLPFLLARAGVEGVRVTACCCLGACGSGANLVIYPEGTFYKGVTPGNIEVLVETHFVQGKPLEALVVAP